MKTRRMLVVAGFCAAVLVAAAAPADAGGRESAPLTIEKVVVGTAPPGTQFLVQIQCETDSNSIDEVVFDEFGEPIGPNVVTFGGPNECLVDETQTGGAQVSYECEGTIPPPSLEEPPVDGGFPVPEGQPITDPCSAPGPTPEPITVFIVASTQEATVTVTNTFAPPPEPAAVVVEPSFTG